METHGVFSMSGGDTNDHDIWGGTLYASVDVAGSSPEISIGQYMNWYGAAYALGAFDTADHGYWDRSGSIELKKVWSGTAGQTTVQIGTTAGGTQVDTQQTGAGGAAPLTTGANTVDSGTYYMSESGGLSGYSSHLACEDAAGPVAVGANNSVAVASGEAVVCTFTNTALGTPTITTQADPTTGVIGTVLQDTATLIGGNSPTGDVVFYLYGPSDPTCADTAVYFETDSSAPYATAIGVYSNALGVWHWKAHYVGDANNFDAWSLCADEPVTVVPVNTTLTKSVSPSDTAPAGVFTYTVTITNASPAGSVTLDAIKDRMPAGATYLGPSAYNSVAIGDPAIVGLDLTWTGPLVVPASSSRTLTYDVRIPSQDGCYTNSVFALIGSTQIDTTVAIDDDAPATARVCVGKPNLTVSKTHDPAGPFIVGEDFDWIITVSNNGSVPATFTAAPLQTILVDYLPDTGTTYPASATVAPVGGITGTIVCPIVTNIMTCTPSGGPVMIDPSGSFTVTFQVSTISGSALYPLVNPTSGNCRVDPSGVIAETNESGADNSCSDTVTINKATPTISTLPSAGGAVGITLNDTATLTGGDFPTGIVVFNLYHPTDPNCELGSFYEDSDGDPPYATYHGGFTTSSAGTWHWTATYVGDDNNNPVTSDCADEPVTVTAPVAPDLTVTKDNNTGDAATLGNSFDWTLTVANGGDADATFADGETILEDHLPDTATYGVPTVGNDTNITGLANISCSVVSSLLTCTANNGSVTIGATTGSFTVTVKVGPKVTGDRVNPTGGICMVDPPQGVTAPVDVIDESDETNNTCSDTVTVSAPDLTVVKENDTSDVATLGSSFNWTLNVANGRGSRHLRIRPDHPARPAAERGHVLAGEPVVHI